MSVGGGNHAVAKSIMKIKNKWATIFSLRIASSTLQTTDVRLMGLNRFEYAVRGAFATGNDGVAPVIRDLGGLEGEVKNAGECRGYVGTQGCCCC